MWCLSSHYTLWVLSTTRELERLTTDNWSVAEAETRDDKGWINYSLEPGYLTTHHTMAEARHKSPASLSKLSARRMRQTIIESVKRIKGKNDSWVPRYFPCREPLSVSRHAIKTLHDYLLSTPHLYQVNFIICIGKKLSSPSPVPNPSPKSKFQILNPKSRGRGMRLELTL